MEINEVVSYFLNIDTNILEVSFRTIDDSDDVIRTDNIDFSLTEEYGFELVNENYDYIEDDDEVEDEIIDDVELDEDELLSFLNEYYTIHPECFPETQIF